MSTFYRALEIFIQFIEVLLILRILMSIMNANFSNTIGRMIYELTEPVLSLSRRIVYRLGINTGMFDFSTILAVLLLRLSLEIMRRIIF